MILLKKAIFGLKQSGREWYKYLNGTFMKLGFLKSAPGVPIVYRHNTRGHAIISTAVDDPMITAAKQLTLDEIKESMKQIFKMKDLGEIHQLLNLKIKQDWHSKITTISQFTYIVRGVVAQDKQLC